MANEILYAGLVGERASEALSGMFIKSIAAREMLPSHPALLYFSGMEKKGSSVIEVPIKPLGAGAMSAIADGASVTNSAYASSSASITLSRQAFARSISDLAVITDPGDIRQEFVQEAVTTWQNQLMNLVCQAGSAFTSTVSTTGVDLTLAKFLEAKQALVSANNQGPYLAVLHPQQFADLGNSLLTATGTVQWQPESGDALRATGTGRVGTLFGVDIVISNYVPTANAGADRAGFMVAAGGIVLADARIVEPNSPDRLVIGEKLMIERQKDISSGVEQFVYSAFAGCAIGVQAGGVAIISDA